MNLVDKRQDHAKVKVADLKAGKVYEDHDGDIMIWTQEGKMIVLSSPEDTACVGTTFTPDINNMYVLVTPTLMLQ